MRLPLSANLGFLWKELPLVQRIARAAAAGFDAVEFHDDWRHCDLDDLARALRQSGLRLETLNTQMGESFGLAALPGHELSARAAIDAALDAAARLGAKAVHVTAGKADVSPASQAVYRANLQYACALAAPRGIAVLVEPLAPAAVPGYFLSSLEQADTLLGEIPGLMLMFDCCQVAAMGHDLEQAFAQRVSRIGHVQIAGIPGRNEPSTGTVDCARLLCAMRNCGYRGSFGAEYRPLADVESGLGWMLAFR